ncbi:hypothetical protein C0W92_15000 [Photobacterium angustum]|uniref:Lipoprotein n=2 Tax=Photobacterium angustum TaxID=661 RepID=Q1ZR00_PHOAS|nr:hypothetical protein [Photobacterium angustum]KJF80884.1 hypothetical protein UB36_14580 [Photobacterium damselae subsp. damselae]EAS64653.1 hypothetical protein VAS14_03018 [Photobacterium angustum S14]KJG00157.1 hypothetical protein UB35_19465 [Photobacterium angustum]KJG19187.1 hypothetical protein UA33_04000 [Photobacterium angustum]KJG19575.1 hypothetical protein UA39_21180 [Photobacterium angustum]
MRKLLASGAFGFGIVLLTGCSGITHNKDVYTAHAESFNIIGFQVPGNTKERVMELIPEGATVETVQSTNSDTTSVLGVLNRIIGIDYVQVGGKKQ